jgi:hypothetical protein
MEFGYSILILVLLFSSRSWLLVVFGYYGSSGTAVVSMMMRGKEVYSVVALTVIFWNFFM